MERPDFYKLTNKYYNINLSRNEIEAKVVKDIDDYIDYLGNKLSEQQLLPELNKIDIRDALSGYKQYRRKQIAELRHYNTMILETEICWEWI